MALRDWSTTPASNASAGSINWAEGQAPSTVNDSARQMMADVADWTKNPGPEWYPSDVATFASGTTFTVSGNQTTNYTQGRRIRAVNLGGTFYGSVVSATFGTNTTVTVIMDSGSLDAGLSDLRLGIINPTNTSFPSIISTSAITATNLNVGTITATGAETYFTASGATLEIGNPLAVNTPAIDFHSSGNNIDYDARLSSSGGSAVGQAAVTLTASGGFTCTGDITAFSDETVKTDWRDLPDDYIDRLAAIQKVGTFTRIDSYKNHRQVGLGAQSLAAILPEAVNDNGEMLSIAYGNAALATCVYLARRILALEEKIRKLGSKS